jgi:hypothetical protein
MKKVILFSLMIVLIATLILPAISAPKSAEAAGTTVACSPASGLYFRVYEGVPTYLLGFIPLSDQKLTLTLSGSGISGWTVSDNAGWLNEGKLFGVLSSISSKTRTTTVGVSVNSNGLTPGTHTAVITFKITTSNTKTITVPVTVEVIAPRVLGPLGIGIDRIFGAEDEYAGLTTNLLTNPDNMMDMQAIQTDGGWNLQLQRGESDEFGNVNIVGGTITIGGVTKQIISGGIAGLASLAGSMPIAGIPAGFDWGDNYIVGFDTDDVSYIAFLIKDIGALLPLLGALTSVEAVGEVDISALSDLSAAPAVNQNTGSLTSGITIPLNPILGLLPILMPVFTNLLANPTVMAIITPLLALLPPIMVFMPVDLFGELLAALMPS